VPHGVREGQGFYVKVPKATPPKTATVVNAPPSPPPVAAVAAPPPLGVSVRILSPPYPRGAAPPARHELLVEVRSSSPSFPLRPGQSLEIGPLSAPPPSSSSMPRCRVTVPSGVGLHRPVFLARVPRVSAPALAPAAVLQAKPAHAKPAHVHAEPVSSQSLVEAFPVATHPSDREGDVLLAEAVVVTGSGDMDTGSGSDAAGAAADANPFVDDANPFDDDDAGGGGGGVAWAVAPFKAAADAEFHAATPEAMAQGRPALSPRQVKALLLPAKSGLPNALLRQVWALSDVDGDGVLDADEFAVATYLCHLARQGTPLPATLPFDVVPPSKRKPSNPF